MATGTVEDLVKKLKGLPKFIEDVVEIYYNDNKEEILDLNKAQLLNSGVDSEGKPLGEYAPFTVEERQKKGLQTDFIDLRYTGKFQDRMQLSKNGVKGEREMTSRDPKWGSDDGVLRKAFPDAIGLTPNSQEILTTDIEKEIDRNVNGYL